MVRESRQNNFNLVRLAAALLVMAGHMGPILGIPELTFAGFGLHTLGVEILFLIGGYLVAGSWLHDPHPLRYGARRFLRLWPPFAAAVLMMTFAAGPLLSSLGSGGYFGSWWKAYLENLRLYIVYAQPGVFAEQPIPNVTNGSFWTMPVEAALYVITPLLLSWIVVRKGRKTPLPVCLALGAALITFGSWLDSRRDLNWIVYATDWAAGARLAVFYGIGIICRNEEIRKYFHLQFALPALLAMLLVQQEASWIRYTVMEIALPYVVFSLALAPEPRFRKLGSKYELSYGIYLYGFFFQQLAVLWQRQAGQNWGMTGTLLVSLAMTVPAAWLSCVLIERPMQKITGKLTRRKNHAES